MLTHDVEPIIDTLRAVKRQFSNQVSAAYLRFSEGTITEQIINDADIMTFAQICHSVTESQCDDIIKLIYLRRHYEILDEKGDAYQVLSNLFHKRISPVDSREAVGADYQYPLMDAAHLFNGCADILVRIPTFDYSQLLAALSCEEHLRALYARCQNGYEKLQVFRLLEINTRNSVIQKFVNETYHIENQFICQLDPTQFDLIPEYVITECDRLLNLPSAAANEEAAVIPA
jgi:hypothetical protein